MFSDYVELIFSQQFLFVAIFQKFRLKTGPTSNHSSQRNQLNANRNDKMLTRLWIVFRITILSLCTSGIRNSNDDGQRQEEQSHGKRHQKTTHQNEHIFTCLCAVCEWVCVFFSFLFFAFFSHSQCEILAWLKIVSLCVCVCVYKIEVNQMHKQLTTC